MQDCFLKPKNLCKLLSPERSTNKIEILSLLWYSKCTCRIFRLLLPWNWYSDTWQQFTTIFWLCIFHKCNKTYETSLCAYLTSWSIPTDILHAQMHLNLCISRHWTLHRLSFPVNIFYNWLSMPMNWVSVFG